MPAATPAARARHRAVRQPRGPWLFLALVLLVVAAALLVEGYTHGVLGESPQTANQAGARGRPGPPALVNGGPVINAAGARPFSYQIPARTVVLSFDDGPDPTWTPRILAVLRRWHVPANFFVVGAHAASWPGLVREELRAGDEVGSHTYTHVNLATAGWQLPLQLTLTQNALAGAAGVRTDLLRPPYSSVADALTAVDWRAYQRVARYGYLIVLATADTRDWARPGVARIVRNATHWPGQARHGAVIMLHDAGGNRAETVRALPLIIAALRARGYRFSTITAALRLPWADTPVTPRQRLIGAALVLTQQAADHSVAVLAVALVVASVLLVLRLLALVCFAAAHRRRVRRLPVPRRPRAAPGISVIAPAYNEAAGIAATVRSMVASRYPGELEVIVVDDGSTDDTAAIVRGLRLPGVRLISQRNAGKPAALNRGILAARHDLLVLVDGDTIFDRDALAWLAARFEDPLVGAASGNTKVANRGGLLGRWQHLEYVMGFNLDRRMFDILGTIPTVPGAIGAVRRSGWQVVYEPRAIAWTEAPSTLRQLWRQRYRWCYGTMQAMWKHRRSVIERGASGRFGRRCLSYLTFYQVLLPVIAPVVDLAAVYGVLFLNLVTVAAFWAGFNVLQLIACGYALAIDRERLRTLWALPLQQVVYRQLMYLVTIQSLMTALLGTRQRWQAMSRTGVFGRAAEPAPPPARRPDLAR